MIIQECYYHGYPPDMTMRGTYGEQLKSLEIRNGSRFSREDRVAVVVVKALGAAVAGVAGVAGMYVGSSSSSWGFPQLAGCFGKKPSINIHGSYGYIYIIIYIYGFP